MSIRFSTEAANADVLGDDTTTEGTPREVGADGTPRDRGDSRPARKGQAADVESDHARPGQDINAPGFVKDRDAGKPS
jgi:hypothetical protein